MPPGRAAGIQYRSISPIEVNVVMPVCGRDLPMYSIGQGALEGWIRKRWPSRTLSRSPRPIRTTGEVVERNRRVAGRRAAGHPRRSVSRNTVAMRPSSCGAVDGYPLTTARIVTAMCQNTGGTQIEGVRGAAPSLSPAPHKS